MFMMTCVIDGQFYTLVSVQYNVQNILEKISTK